MGKKTLRFSSFLIAILLVISSVPFVAAADNGMTGITFKADPLFKSEKLLDTTPNTFEAWVRFPKSTSGSKRGGIIIGNFNGSGECINFEILQRGNPRLYWVEGDGTVFDWQFTDVSVYTGEWEHVTVVRDSKNLKAYCYINGELKQTLSISETRDVTGSLPLIIGGDHRSGNVQYFKGEISSIALYSDIRTADQIRADMTAPAKDSLILGYDLSGTASSDTVTDFSSNGYDQKKLLTWIENKEEVTDYAYSFMAIGDTQILAEKYPVLFRNLYNYVLSNIESKNVQFVFGLGDITNKSTAAEWEVATECIYKLDGKVRYSVVRGNHDKAADYDKAFPLSKYENIIGGAYSKFMRNYWQEFSVGSIKYLVLSIDFGASDAVLEWASEIIEAHPEHNVIITTHCYLYRDGTTLDEGDVCPPSTLGEAYNNGDEMWDKLIRKHENIVLVLSGHDPCSNIVMTQTQGDHGNTVTQMLIDGQSVDSSLSGVGLVAIFYISADGRNVTVEYFSTSKGKFFMSENQFSFTLNVIGAPPLETSAPSSDSESAPSAETSSTETVGDAAIMPAESPSYTLLIVFGITAFITAASVVLLLVIKKKRQII